MSKEIIINNLPSTQRRKFGFNNINKSEDHNNFQEEILNDILDLSNKINNIERTYNTNINNIKLENSYLQSMNDLLVANLEAFNDQLSNINNKDKIKIINPTECINIASDISDGASNIDMISGDITLNGTRKESKIAIYDSLTNSIFMPETLNVSTIDTTKPNVISFSDSDLYAPFSSDDQFYYVRDVVTSSDISTVSCEYIIDLPIEISTTDEINEIFIEAFLCNVTNVEARHGNSSTWRKVPGFDYHRNNKVNDSIKGIGTLCGGMKLNFKSIKANQIKISLRCDKYTERESNIRKFTYGLKQVGVYYNKYKGTDGTFKFIADLGEYGNHSLIIKDIYPEYNNSPKDSYYVGDFSKDVYYLDENNHEHKIVDTFPFTPTTNKLVVKCKFGTKYPEANINNIKILYNHI